MAKAATKTNIDTSMYMDGSFKEIAEKCDGCERIIEVKSTRICKTYIDPEAKWRLGICNFASHIKPEIKVQKVRINPIKASKRASKA